MINLDPNRLLSLRTVVRAGSISAGARALGWTQQAVSQQLREMERQIGQPLLLRTYRGVQPTDAGRVLLAHANAIASNLNEAMTELTELSRLEQGTVRLTAAVTDMMSLIPRALCLLGDGIDVTLFTADPESAVQLLHDGDVDLAVTHQFADDPVIDSKSLVADELGREPYCVVTPAGRLGTKTDGVALAELADQLWVTGCDYCERHLVVSAQTAGFTPRIIQRTSDHLIAQAFVAHGLALTMVPQSIASVFPDPRVEALIVPELTKHVTIVMYRPGAEQVPAIAAALDALRQAARTATVDPDLSR